jgi:ABC-type glycerol-3-phosphate transport system substrate-binding protein
MPDTEANGTREPESQGHPSRRDFLKFSGLGVGALALATGAGRTGLQLGKTAASRRVAASSAKTLNIWGWGSSQAIHSNFQAVADTFPSLFNNVDLKVTLPGSSDGQVAEKLSLTYAANTTLPDIVQLNYTEVPEFAAAGLLADTSAYLKPVEHNLYAGAVSTAQYNGSWVTFPFSVNSKLFFYRADLFAQAGIDPEAITSVEEYLAAGKQFTKKFPNQHIINVSGQPQQYLFDLVYSAFYPISFYDKAAKKWDITTNSAFAESFEFIRELTTIAYPVDDFTKSWPTAINKGNIAGFLTANWMRAFLPGYAGLGQKGQWRALPWPKLVPNLKDERYGSDAGGAVYVVPDGAPNKNLALELLAHWFANEDGALAAFRATNFTPMLKSVEPELLSLIKAGKKPASMSETDWEELPQNFFPSNYYATELETYNYARAFDFDPSALKEVFTIAQPWFDKVTGSKMSIGSILAGMQADMESQIGNPFTAAA